MYATLIYQSPSTVFTTGELALLFGETDGNRLKSRLHYYVVKGVLSNPRRGIYTKPNFSYEELATKLYTPSYISLETVLLKEGVIFQHYETIFVISYLTRTIKVGDREICYRRVTDKILNDSRGLVNMGNYVVAIKERAFLDALYLYKNYFFDNLAKIDKNVLKKLLPVYPAETIKKAYEYCQT